jgi:hypothetical protein
MKGSSQEASTTIGARQKEVVGFFCSAGSRKREEYWSFPTI